MGIEDKAREFKADLVKLLTKHKASIVFGAESAYDINTYAESFSVKFIENNIEVSVKISNAEDWELSLGGIE